MTLTSEARQHLDRYLEEMRASMPAEESADVEQDIRDHIDAELGERPSPVSAGDLDSVLVRLGSPRQWGVSEVAVAPRGGAEDWLAYASLALLLLGFLLPFFLPVSWLIARWTLARIEHRGEQPGTRRWLLYPPIAVVSIAVAVLILIWPLGLFGELAQRFGAPVRVPALAFAMLGGYWIVVGTVAALAPRAVRFLFHPFADGFRRGHA